MGSGPGNPLNTLPTCRVDPRHVRLSPSLFGEDLRKPARVGRDNVRFFHPQVFSSRIGAAGSVKARDPLRLSLYGGFMTKEEVQAFLEKLGVKVGEITDDVIAKVENAKAQLDTETRRKVRTFWIGMTMLALVLGIGIGYLL